jgi:hypothetical protein
VKRVKKETTFALKVMPTAVAEAEKSRALKANEWRAEDTGLCMYIYLSLV